VEESSPVVEELKRSVEGRAEIDIDVAGIAGPDEVLTDWSDDD